jgi:rod shape-determining protein MreC
MVALVLVLVPSMLSVFGYSGLVRNAIKTAATPFEWCGRQVADAVNGFVSVFTEYDELLSENKELKDKLAALENDQYEISVLRDQNDWLKNYLDFKEQSPEFAITNATVISREAGNYATILTVNKGTVHGIRKHMPVITEDGVFGYVSECGVDWAKVVSIVETASAVSVYSDRTGVTGVVEGDTTLRKDGFCVMTYIASNADIKVGDRIFTSGNGNIYPSGLLVGEITEISADETTRTLSAVIKPSVDFGNIEDIKNIIIITGYAEDAAAQTGDN